MEYDKEDLLKGLSYLGFPITAETRLSFSIYLRQLQKWGKIHTLTSKLSDQDIVAIHFLDSLLYLRVFPPGNFLQVADVGSGAGFPGIPLALLRPDSRFTLYEPAGKKARFLRHIIRTLAIKNVSVTEARVQDDCTRNAYYDVIATRALYGPNELIEATQGLIRPGGMWILSQGSGYKVPALPQIVAQVRKEKFRLPLQNVDRWLIILISADVPRGTS